MGDSGRGGETLLGSQCTEMEELIRFADGLDMESLRKKQVKQDSDSFVIYGEWRFQFWKCRRQDRRNFKGENKGYILCILSYRCLLHFYGEMLS